MGTKGGECVNYVRPFSDFSYERVADLSKKDFEKLLNECFEEFITSNELRSLILGLANETAASIRP